MGALGVTASSREARPGLTEQEISGQTGWRAQPCGHLGNKLSDRGKSWLGVGWWGEARASLLCPSDTHEGKGEG